MITLEEIQNQIKECYDEKIRLAKSEVKYLPEVIHDDEKIIGLVEGFYKDAEGNGLLVATTKRVIFIYKGWLSSKVEDFLYTKISSIQYESGIISGEIKVHVSGNNGRMTHVGKTKGVKFCEIVRNKMENPTIEGNSNQEDTLSKLERLSNLFEKGILNEQEFKAQKELILKKQ